MKIKTARNEGYIIVRKLGKNIKRSVDRLRPLRHSILRSLLPGKKN